METKAFTDDTKMPFGKHQGKRMEEVPADYLIWLYDEYKDTLREGLRLYIEDNLDVLKKEIKEKSNG